MVLILSDEFDLSTNNVIDYLKYFGVSYFRINNTNPIKIIELVIDDCGVSFELEVNLYNEISIVNIKDVDSFWYRRGWFTVNSETIKKGKNIQDNYAKSIDKYIELENKDLIQFLYKYFNGQKHIGYFNDNFTNKLYNLKVASDVGFKIPKSIITSNKNDVIKFLKNNGKAITKAVREGGFSLKNGFLIGTLSKLLTVSSIDKIPNDFQPSLLQEYIEKEVELRIFYLHDECYAASIFSQLDNQTKIDFRNYNNNRPNRVQPFKLPSEVITKIKLFMDKIGYTSGSLDVIYTKKKGICVS